MKRMLTMLVITSTFMMCLASFAAGFDSGSTCPGGLGCLGDYTPSNPSSPTTVIIDLPKSGILNYGNVTIPANLTVTFRNYSANKPVYMLASGAVTIDGAINIAGTNATSSETGRGGPGGYDGGWGGTANLSGGRGMGPGGGGPGGPDIINAGFAGGGGGFATTGSNSWEDHGIGGSFYGNATLLPMIGGSGGGGGGWTGGGSYIGGNGGGGGGAILIASSTSITVNGSITANGGNGTSAHYSNGSGGGSGGAIKLMANIVSGNGAITATGGTPGSRGGTGSIGRIRIETNAFNRTAISNPPHSYGSPGNVFVANMPSLTITSIAGQAAPSSPTGSYSQPDIFLPGSTTNPVTVYISAANIPDNTTVKVWVIPQFGNATSVDSTLSSSAASANVNLSATYANVVTAEATFTVVGMYYNGEEIEKVRVASTFGGKSGVVYITKSGKEIRGDLVAALMK